MQARKRVKYDMPVVGVPVAAEAERHPAQSSSWSHAVPAVDGAFTNNFAVPAVIWQIRVTLTDNPSSRTYYSGVAESRHPRGWKMRRYQAEHVSRWIVDAPWRAAPGRPRGNDFSPVTSVRRAIFRCMRPTTWWSDNARVEREPSGTPGAGEGWCHVAICRVSGAFREFRNHLEFRRRIYRRSIATKLPCAK